MPFEVPSSWVWTTVGEISQSILYGVSESAKSRGTYRLLRITDIQDNTVNWNTVPFTDYEDEKAEAYLLKDGDILFARTGATVGKSYLVNNLQEKAIYASYLIRVKTNHYVLPEFVKYFFESGFYWEQVLGNSVGIGQPNVNGTILSNLELPIPPIMEQKRIVKELGKWLSIIDKIEESKGLLQKNISWAKSKVLDLAIHGKLVPQDPTDEPATELLKRINPNAEITSDNGHYQKLPEGWAVCCLENVAKVLDNLRKPINSNERNSRIANKHENELFPYYGATGQVGFIDDYLVDGTFLLLGEDGAPFLDKYAIKSYPIKGKCWVNNHAHILEPQCDFDYLMYYLNHVDYKDYVNGSTRLKLTQSDMRSIIILLPPLTEQKRISVKVKYLFRLLDSIACNL